MVSTPTTTSEEPARTIAANADTIVLTMASGGQLIDTIAPMPMPAHITIWDAKIGIRNALSSTVWPNHVQRIPASSRYRQSALIIVWAAMSHRLRMIRAAAATASRAITRVDGINGLSKQ